MTDAAVTAFAVVFTVFVVATLVLIVLVLRFTFQRASLSRSRWLDRRGAGTGGGTASALAEQEEERDEDGEEPDRTVTALVFAGGGTRGAVQIGMLQVLAEHGFVPDRIYGTSVGAVNGAGFAGDPTPEGVERMARIWAGLDKDDIFPAGRLHGPWAYFQQRDAVYSNSGLRRVIEEGVSFERLEEAAVPFEVVATSLVDGRERWFTYGPAVEAILASAALPAIFPPVEIDGERYVDGGVINNVPIRRAIEAGASRIVVLMCSPPVFEPSKARRPIESVLNALFISVHARFARDMAQLPPGVEVVVCSAGAPGEGGRGFGDFSPTAELIAEGRREAAEVVRRYGAEWLGAAPTASSAVAADPASPPTTGSGPAAAAAAGGTAPTVPSPTTDGSGTTGEPPAAEPGGSASAASPGAAAFPARALSSVAGFGRRVAAGPRRISLRRSGEGRRPAPAVPPPSSPAAVPAAAPAPRPSAVPASVTAVPSGGFPAGRASPAAAASPPLSAPPSDGPGSVTQPDPGT